MELQTYYAEYEDRNGKPLYVGAVHANGRDEAIETAFLTCPPGAEFEIIEPDEPSWAKQSSRATTHTQLLSQLAARAAKRNTPPLWAERLWKRQKARRVYAEKALAHFPATLVYGCFSKAEEDYEFYRITERLSFVAPAEFTLDEVMVLAMENLGEMKGDYLAGLDPATGKVVIKIMLK